MKNLLFLLCFLSMAVPGRAQSILRNVFTTNPGPSVITGPAVSTNGDGTLVITGGGGATNAIAETNGVGTNTTLNGVNITSGQVGSSTGTTVVTNAVLYDAFGNKITNFASIVTNGSALSNLSGTLPTASLPASVLTNNWTGPITSQNGFFSGTSSNGFNSNGLATFANGALLVLSNGLIVTSNGFGVDEHGSVYAGSSGDFNGSGAGLTAGTVPDAALATPPLTNGSPIPATNLTGAINPTNLPASVVTNNSTGVTLNSLSVSNFTSLGGPDQARDLPENYIYAASPSPAFAIQYAPNLSDAGYGTNMSLWTNVVQYDLSIGLPITHAWVDSGLFSGQDATSGLMIPNSTVAPLGIPFYANFCHTNNIGFGVYVSLSTNDSDSNPGIGLGYTQSRNAVLQTNAWQFIQWGVDWVELRVDNSDNWTPIQQQNDVNVFCYWLRFYATNSQRPIVINYAERKQVTGGFCSPWIAKTVNQYYPPNPGFNDTDSFFKTLQKYIYFSSYNFLISPGHTLQALAQWGNYDPVFNPSEKAALTLAAIGGYSLNCGWLINQVDVYRNNQDVLNVLTDPGGLPGEINPRYTFYSAGFTNSMATNDLTTNYVIVKPIMRYSSPTIAVALVNAGIVADSFTLSLTNLGYIGMAPSVIYDCWNHTNVGFVTNGTFSYSVAATNADLLLIQNIPGTNLAAGQFLNASGLAVLSGTNVFSVSPSSVAAGSSQSEQWGAGANGAGAQDTAVGFIAAATGGADTACGENAKSTAGYGVALGEGSVASGYGGCISIGPLANTHSFSGIRIGFGDQNNVASVTQNYNIVIGGYSSDGAFTNCTVIGDHTVPTGPSQFIINANQHYVGNGAELTNLSKVTNGWTGVIPLVGSNAYVTNGLIMSVH